MDIQTLNKIGDSLRKLRVLLDAELYRSKITGDVETARELRSEIIDIQQQILAVTNEVKAAQFRSADNDLVSMDVATLIIKNGNKGVTVTGCKISAVYTPFTGVLEVSG